MVSAAGLPMPHSSSSHFLASAAFGVRDGLPQRRDLLGELPGPPGRLALPVRHRRRRAVRVGHPDRARLDPADAPGVGAEQEDVAGPALYRPLLVDGADLDLVGFGHDPEVAELGDGPARGQRGQPGAAAPLDGSVHPVPVQVVGATAAAGADPLGQQVGDVLEVLGGQVAERRRPPGQAEQLAFGPGFGGRLGHHLLRQDVQRPFRDHDGVQPPLPRAAQQSGAFDQLVPGGRVQPPGRRPGAGVVGPADPLQEGGEAPRRADLADQLHRPHVDAELQRGGGHQGAQVPGAQPGLDPLPAAPGQRPVVRRHLSAELVAEPLAQLVGDPLGHAPGVDEHQRGPVAGHVPRDHVQDLRHLLPGGDRAELVVGQFQGEVQLPAVAGIHDRAPGRPVRVVPVGSRADQQPGDGLDRPLGRGQPHPLHRLRRDVRQPLQGQGQVRAPLVPGDRVDLVHDHGPRAAQHGPAPLRGQQQVERLRGSDQDVRRVLEHGGPLGGRRVAGPDRHPDVRRAQPEPGGHRGDLAQRRLQVLMNVGGQRLQRRHVHHLRPRPGRPLRLLAPPRPPAASRPRARSTDRARSTGPGRGRTGRCRPGTPPASCRIRWAPRSGCGGPRRSPATPRPAARSAPLGSGPRTRHARRDGTTRAPAHGTSGPRHSSR